MINGTAGLHVALSLVGVGTDDEVIVPALTFVATANAVAYCGAIPHFVDAEGQHLGLDPQKLRLHLDSVAKYRERCLHQPSDRPPNSSRRPGSRVRPPGRHGCPNCGLRRFRVVNRGGCYRVARQSVPGSALRRLVRVGALSFNGNKIVTTGGGGAVVTNDAEIALHAKHLTTTAKMRHQWDFVHDEIGCNYRLPNLNAALGLAQLEQLSGFVDAKRQLAQALCRRFRKSERRDRRLRTGGNRQQLLAQCHIAR